MSNFTIDDAIEKCEHIAFEMEHNPKGAAEWIKTAAWLIKLKNAAKTIQQADLDYVSYQAGENIFDLRDRQKDHTIEQVTTILEGLAK